MRRIYNLLRSRKLAFWLIGAFVVYSAVATSVAKGDFGAAYANPLFYAIATALALATAACAWERTAGAARAWRAGGSVGADFVGRLERAPQIAVPLPDGADREAVLGRVADALHGHHLRVKTAPDRLFAGSARLALVGSPLFHWALVAIFVVVAAGRLTRSEGLMGVPVGSEVPDAAASYGALEEGPLHDPAFSGLTIAVPDLDLDYVAGGVERGAAPLVEVYDGEELVASRLVYPNSPLRYGSLMIHPNAYGLAGAFVFETADATDPVDVLYDFEADAPLATVGSPLVFDSADGTFSLTTRVPLDVEGRTAPWVLPAQPRVEWVLDKGGVETSGTIAPGESITLGEGVSIRLERVTYYARISVVDDWSVYPLYAVLVLAVIGLALALLLPPKSAWVMLVENEQGTAIHARTRQSRADRLFAETVARILTGAAEGKDGRP